MTRISAFATAVAAGAVVAGCGSVHAVVPPPSGPQGPSYRAASPFLSTKNYIEMFPVAQAGIDIALGSDKKMWFTTGGYVVSIDPSGNETYYSNSQGLATHIAAGQRGVLWFSNFNNYISSITTGGTITSYFVGALSKTLYVALGPDLRMWFTDQGTNSIGNITSGGQTTEYAIPSGAKPVGITAGPDGNIWFSANGGPTGEEFGVVTPTGSFTEYPIAAGTPGGPGAMTKGPDGNLYATNSVGGVFSVTTGGVSTYYPTSFTSNFENGIAVGPDKQIWISPGDAADDLVEFNTSKHTFGKAAMVPGCGNMAGVPRGLALGPDGDMWFVTEGCAYVGVYEEKILAVGIRLTGESSFNDPNYGFELGYFDGLKSMTSQTVVLSMGESVRFTNVDPSLTHTASFLGDASQNNAPWPATFDGSSTQSPAGTLIGSTGFSTGALAPGKSSLVYETGIPGFYMIGCAFHYNADMMRTVIIVH